MSEPLLRIEVRRTRGGFECVVDYDDMSSSCETDTEDAACRGVIAELERWLERKANK